jgi:hypothetical protein
MGRDQYNSQQHAVWMRQAALQRVLSTPAYHCSFKLQSLPTITEVVHVETTNLPETWGAAESVTLGYHWQHVNIHTPGSALLGGVLGGAELDLAYRPRTSRS